MKRFILPDPPEIKRGIIRLSGRNYHYLTQVRRFKPGTLFKAFLPNGEEIQVEGTFYGS